mgnify:CR=1 FL=1
MTMNMKQWVADILASDKKKSLPVLSFPSIQKMGITVSELINSSDKQAEGMKIIADSCPTAASVSLMDLSLEAEAFGSTIRVSDDEVPTVIGSIVSTEEEAEALKFRKSVQVVPRFILMLSKSMQTHHRSSGSGRCYRTILPGRQTFGRIRSTDLLLRRAGYGTYRSAEK